jgi:hypothetical protein
MLVRVHMQCKVPKERKRGRIAASERARGGGEGEDRERGREHIHVLQLVWSITSFLLVQSISDRSRFL